MRQHDFTRARWLGTTGISLLIAVVSFLVAAALGEESLSFSNAWDAGSTDFLILFSLRLPRVVLAAMVGAALAASGAALQCLLRNPLADPFVLGVSGGAALGATVALAFGAVGMATIPGLAAVSTLALAGAVGATALVLLIGRLAGEMGRGSILLAGVIFNAFALAAITFIKALVAPDKLGEILFWLAGSLGHESWKTLGVVGLLVALCLVFIVALAPRLNLLALGEDDAQSLGVDVERTRRLVLLAASGSVALVVSLSGLVGFVGLLVPQLVRRVVGPDQRLAIPASAFLGASFLMLADLAARLLFLVFHTEPPVGVITALLGGPLFLSLMARRTIKAHA